MYLPVIALMVFLLPGYVYSKDPDIEEEEIAAYNFMAILNKKTEEMLNKYQLAKWDYVTNLTDENLQKKLEVGAEMAKFQKEAWQQVISFNWRRFSDYYLRRQFFLYSVLGDGALPPDKYKRLKKIVDEMENIFSTAKICAFNDTQKCDLALNPDITNIMSTSRNEEELKHVWIAWRNAVGPKCRDLFENYVKLSNEAARLNNFTDTSEYWLHGYEDPQFKDKIKNIYEQLKPLYLQLHAYVRLKLRQKYGDVVSETGPIPAHLLGDIMAQNWRGIADFTLPFPNVGDTDLTQELMNQNYTAIRIVKVAEEFFKSINLTAMPDSFWGKSIFTKSEDRPMVCMASSWDFSDRKDFRVKLCLHNTPTDFNIAHHEMGHIEYYLHYKDLPVKFRRGANDGFHEAVGDLISLSVLSTKHLRQVGLLHTSIDHRVDLNNIYKVGLHKIMFLPFSYLMELWRWDIFSGKTKPEDYNCKWWELREKYQGVEASIDRSEEDFDPASKYHIISGTPYLRYFIALILQFQFHRKLCEKAGQYDPISHYSHLHNCDIYQSTEAGNALKKMLAMGASKPWPDALEALIGQREMDATAILEYFQPLHEWLKNENKKNGAFIGWESSKRVCTRTKKEPDS